MRSRLMKEALEGMLAGMAMAMLAMGAMLIRGQSPWRPVKLMAATLGGPGAAEGGAGTILLGGMIHLMMSALFGLLFRPVLTLLGWRGTPPLPVAGLLYALGLFAVNESVTLPAVDPTMARRMPRLLFALSHLAYGMTLGVLTSQIGPTVATALAPRSGERIGRA
ncbi:MAG: hypothetical protein ACRDIY_21830 [Chloroflexota bacterium]